MPIISNTSPLLNLAVIDHLHLLRQQFGQIFIPPTVLAELKPDTGYPGVERLKQALAAADSKARLDSPEMCFFCCGTGPHRAWRASGDRCLPLLWWPCYGRVARRR